MSSPASEIPSVSYQTSIISGNLNSSFLLQFISGIYFGLFIITIHTYMRSRPRKNIVIGTLTGLFVTVIVQLILQWDYTSTSFVEGSKNRLDIYLISVEANLTAVLDIILVVVQGIEQILADGLLLWRCWRILSQRRSTKLALVCLYFAELVFLLIVSIFNGLVLFVPEKRTTQFLSRLGVVQGSSLCTAAVASVLATYIIGAEIYQSTSLNSSSRRRYQHIVEITVHSSALYTLLIFTLAVLDLANSKNLASADSAFRNAEVYISALSIITPAFAPTLMVARLEWARIHGTEEFSTEESISESQSVIISAFEASQQHSGSESE